MPCQQGEYHFRQERIFVETGRQNEEAGNSPADCFLTRSGQDPSGTGGKGWPRRAAVIFPVNRHGCISSRESAAFQGRTQYSVTLMGAEMTHFSVRGVEMALFFVYVEKKQ